MYKRCNCRSQVSLVYTAMHLSIPVPVPSVGTLPSSLPPSLSGVSEMAAFRVQFSSVCSGSVCIIADIWLSPAQLSPEARLFSWFQTHRLQKGHSDGLNAKYPLQTPVFKHSPSLWYSLRMWWDPFRHGGLGRRYPAMGTGLRGHRLALLSVCRPNVTSHLTFPRLQLRRVLLRPLRWPVPSGRFLAEDQPHPVIFGHSDGER